MVEKMGADSRETMRVVTLYHWLHFSSYKSPYIAFRVIRLEEKLILTNPAFSKMATKERILVA